MKLLSKRQEQTKQANKQPGTSKQSYRSSCKHKSGQNKQINKQPETNKINIIDTTVNTEENKTNT